MLRTKEMAVISLMTAITCIIAPFSIVLPFSPIPISLGTLAIYLSSTVLGMKRSFITVMLYLLLGFAGLPVFTGFTAGAAKLWGPTGGYMIGYLFMTLICGYFADKWSFSRLHLILGMLLGTMVCYAFGTIWLSIQAGLDCLSALSVAVFPFLPGDLVKIGIAVAMGYQIRKRLKKAALI